MGPSVGLALLETPSAFLGWQRLVEGAVVIPLYMPFVPTTMASLGLDVLALRARTTASLSPRATPSAGLAGWWQLSPSLRLIGDAGVGGRSPTGTPRTRIAPSRGRGLKPSFVVACD